MSDRSEDGAVTTKAKITTANGGDVNAINTDASVVSKLGQGLGRLSTFSSWNQRNEAEEYYLGATCRLLKSASIVGVQTYIFLLVMTLLLLPKSSFQYLDNRERAANTTILILLAVTNGSKITPLFFRENFSFKKSGVLVCSCTVQGLAVVSVALMSFFPTPVVTDNVTGMQAALVRWIEWIVLAFLMSFLTDSIDLPNKDNRKDKEQSAWAHGTAIALATSAGILFPFCTNIYSWSIIFVIACVLFSSIYIRLYQTYQRFKKLKKRQECRRINVEDQEVYDRVRLTLRMLQACTITWTLLVVLFVGYRLIPRSLFEEHNNRDSLWVVVESVFEVVSKIWYLNVIMDVHDKIFDENSRALRRLEELREMMSYVWENSSDMIALSLRSNNCMTSIVSPTFLQMLKEKHNLAMNDRNAEDRMALVITMPIDAAGDVNASFDAYDINLSENVYHFNKKRSRNCQFKNNLNPLLRKNIDSMVDLLGKAWSCQERDTLLLHDLHGKTPCGADCSVKCEAKVSRLEHDAVVVILRDISERFRRFEAEKKLVVEVTERKKDAEANRFTRHEVKNGLLAAIAVVDSLKTENFGSSNSASELSLAALDGRSLNKNNKRKSSDTKNETWGVMPPSKNIRRSINEFTSPSLSGRKRSVNTSTAKGEAFDDTAERDKKRPRWANNTSIQELDSTLRQVLDTVLSEAMARDVIHEIYEPNMERIDICLVLQGASSKEDIRQSVRFPIKTTPEQLPQIILDPQILRYIHRNAVSNACKYGKIGGTVTTNIRFDEKKKELLMEVVNQPGHGHEKLLELGEDVVDRIFSSGYRLHSELHDSNNVAMMMDQDEAVVDMSSGDGAWIMQKCANALGGECNIRFEEHQTVFSMVCPARSCLAVDANGAANKKSNATARMKLPASTWGVAIDDSPIQRKLLNHFLSLAMIRNDRRVVVGKDSNEVLGFNKLMKKLLKENPYDKFLVIVDENLDIAEDGAIAHKTVSGSLTIELLRSQLEPRDERRLLTLIRSANDSGPDIALYKRRAHGFIPKAPIKKDSVLELLVPLWRQRFHNDEDISSMSEESTTADNGSSSSGIVTTAKDLMYPVQLIDGLCINCDPTSLPDRWPAIWDKLHSLKGDIKTMKTNIRVRTVLEAIDHLKGEEMPHELVERWKLIKSLVISLI